MSRTVSTVVLGAVAPLVVAVGVAGLGQRAATAAAPMHSRAAAVAAAINPLQCLQYMQSCADAEAQGNPCDLIVC